MDTKTSRAALLVCASLSTLLILGACSSSTRMGTGTQLAGNETGGSTDNSGNGNGDGTGGTGSGGNGNNTGGNGNGGTGGTGTGGSATPASGGLDRVSDVTGDVAGTALVTTGNAVLTGTQLDGVGNLLTETGTSLQNSGLAGTPVLGGTVGEVVKAGDETLNPVAKVVVLDQAVLGSAKSNAQQLVGVSAGASQQTQGTLATAGVLSSGAPINAATQLVEVGVGDKTISTGPGKALVGVGVLAPVTPQGTLATAGVLPGAPASGGAAIAPATNAVGAVTTPVTGVVQNTVQTVGGVVPGGASGGAGAGLAAGLAAQLGEISAGAGAALGVGVKKK